MNPGNFTQDLIRYISEYMEPLELANFYASCQNTRESLKEHHSHLCESAIVWRNNGIKTTATKVNLWGTLKESLAIIIPALANLSGLTFLYLGSNQISDLQPLTILSGIKSLNLCENQIRDVSPLENLPTLTALNLGCNQIRDVRPLSNLTKLSEYLNLGENQIRDVCSLKTLSALTKLYLSYNQISDVTSLAILTLHKLILRGNPITEDNPSVISLREKDTIVIVR